MIVCKPQRFSFSAQLLALFSADGNVHVVASDFTQNLSETFTRTSEPPTQVAWCALGNLGLYPSSITCVFQFYVVLIMKVMLLKYVYEAAAKL
jgi:hypothetical protein